MNILKTIQVFIDIIIVLVIYVVGNKSDLFLQEAVSEREARQFAEKINAKFTLTSCLTGEGVKEIFEEIEHKLKAIELSAKEKKRIRLDDSKNRNNNRSCCSSTNHREERIYTRKEQSSRNTSNKEIALPTYDSNSNKYKDFDINKKNEVVYAKNMDPIPIGDISKEPLLINNNQDLEEDIVVPINDKKCCCCCKKNK